MKNINTLMIVGMTLCVAACNNGALYDPVPDTDTTTMPLSPAPTSSSTQPNAATDLGGTALVAPGFQPTIDGDVFVPQATFFATGLDPQNHPVFMLVVSDQNDLCEQISQGHALIPGAGALATYLYNVDASSGSAALVAPETFAGTYAVFDSSAPDADVTTDPSLAIPMDAGLYASGTFFMLDKMCAKEHRHQLSEGSVTLSAVDTAHAKAAGNIAVLLDDNVSLDANGSFVAQACPALLSMASATGCMLP